MNIAIFISGNGSNFQALYDAILRNELNATIGVVISNNAEAQGNLRANSLRIPLKLICRKNYSNQSDYDNEILGALDDFKIDLVVLAGYLSMLSENIVNSYRNRIINVHPSLIPSFCGKGFYGERVHSAVLSYGVKFTGATVHFVDEGADTGPIILQEPIPVFDSDNIETLSKRVLAVEHRLLVKAVKLITEGKVTLTGRKVSICIEGGNYE